MSGTYWIAAVATPDGDAKGPMEMAKNSIQPSCSEFFPVDCPRDLTFKSFDSLIKLCDDLTKFDSQVESSLRRIEKTMYDFGSNPEFTIVSQKQTYPWKKYLTAFQWDDAKFPKSRTITENLALMMTTVQKLDDEVRNKLNTLQELKSAYGQVSKKEAVSLGTRDLIDVLVPKKVNAADFVETENLSTVVVVVPQGEDGAFTSSYQQMADFIVPDSAKKLSGFEDKERNSLYRVVCFKSAVEAFKTAARAKRFTVREFTYSEEKYGEFEKRRGELEQELGSHESLCKMICRAAFSDTFVAWMHVKMMRTFVESVLRFGVNASGAPRFCAFMMMPRIAEKHIRPLLAEVAEKYGKKEEGDGDAAEEEYYPYVFLTMTPVTAD
jgi:V-type H+-transporting ATPase subunit C